MKLKPAHLRSVAIPVGLAAVLLQGCDSTDKKDTKLKSGFHTFAATSSVKFELLLPDLGLQRSAESPALKAASASTKVQPDRLALVASQDTSYSFQTFPNDSFGKFTSQVTVAFEPGKGLFDGSSAAGLEFEQLGFAPNGRRYYLVAVSNAGISGFTAKVTDFTGAFSSGTPINFPNASQIDLRVQQTGTQLVFSARATPANQSAGGWMPIFTLTAAPDLSAFSIYVGMFRVKKGAIAYFNNFAMDGDAIGGFAEYAIMNGLRTAVNSIRAAEAKIGGTTPDFAGALTDLDAAAVAAAAASNAINTAFTDAALQSPCGAIFALKSLSGAAKDLSTARATVATMDPKKMKSALAKLDGVAGAELSAMANMLGWKAPNLKAFPPIFSLGIP